MSIRVRLALWYAARFALVLSLVGLFSYAFHVHSLYDDLDRTLVMSASHAAAEAAASAGPTIVEGIDVGVATRRYDADGILQETSIRSEQPPPPIDPRTALAAPAGPPFDALVGLVPSLEPLPAGSGEGAFGLLLDPAGQRWRNYVLPLHRGGTIWAGQRHQTVSRCRAAATNEGKWALCYPLIATGLATSPPLTFAALRSFVAGVGLLLPALALRRPLPQGRRVRLGLLDVGLTATGMGFTGMFLAEGSSPHEGRR